jgi:hypothetical protein
MRQIRFIALVVFALALTPSLALALKVYKTADCEAKGHDLRCLLNDSKVPTATVDIKNTGTTAVSFTVDEWHSRCGFAGGKVESNSYELSGGATRHIELQSPGTDAGGLHINCREIFIVGCKEGSSSVSCKDKLTAQYTLWEGNKQ